MAAVPVASGARSSLIGKAAAALSARRASRRGQPSAVATVAARAREHVVTVAALASVDLGAFHVPLHLGPFIGWTVTGVSLLVLDFAVRG